jgi:hypothetical protein
LQHFEIAVGVAECGDGAAADVLVDPHGSADRLSRYSIAKERLPKEVSAKGFLAGARIRGTRSALFYLRLHDFPICALTASRVATRY